MKTLTRWTLDLAGFVAGLTVFFLLLVGCSYNRASSPPAVSCTTNACRLDRLEASQQQLRYREQCRALHGADSYVCPR